MAGVPRGMIEPVVTSGSKLRGHVYIPLRRPKRDIDPVSAYAWDVLQGRIIACRYVILACERHWRDLDQGGRRGLTFSRAKAAYAIDFFRHYLKHSKGEWAGSHVVLAPWQEFALGSVYGWFKRDGTRRFRVAYKEVARKNGKSTTAAGVGIYGLVADREPGAEVYAAATKKDQAKIIFEEAKRMVRSSNALLSRVGVFKNNLSIDNTDSKFEPLSADDRTLDGLNPSLILVDELHKHRTREVLDVLDTAVGSRRQPLLWIITTAGDDDPQSVYSSENDYAIKVLEGVHQDDSFFALIYTLDKGDDWKDPKVWIKANPNLGVSVKLDDLRRQAEKAAKSPPAQSAFKRLRMNLRTSGAEREIDMDVWASNTDGPFDPAGLYGRDFYGGLDVSSKIDLSAWIKLFPPIDDETRWKIVCRFWMPEATVEDKSDRDRVQYQRWIDEGLIEVTPGNVIDQKEIEAAVLEDCRLYHCISAAYDPWNATQLAMNVADQGAPMVEFIQGTRSYSAPTKELEALLLSSKLDHGTNEVLAWMASNVKSIKDRNENRMPSKKHSTGRIDGITSLIMSIGRTMVEAQQSYLEDHDPLSF